MLSETHEGLHEIVRSKSAVFTKTESCYLLSQNCSIRSFLQIDPNLLQFLYANRRTDRDFNGLRAIKRAWPQALPVCIMKKCVFCKWFSQGHILYRKTLLRRDWYTVLLALFKLKTIYDSSKRRELLTTRQGTDSPEALNLQKWNKKQSAVIKTKVSVIISLQYINQLVHIS